ncbi:MAG: cyclic nucleotide-binding domain-containing protein, partial [Rhodospirillaceae bacterium]|nr:cyclic nucleotide-binding domain-containing protein [Rhodospirillaceae bacterium]
MSNLKKIKVTTGVYWVEAPDAGLFILCGAPADVVKHLMRRGLIVDVEEKGVTFESGPNAILLSDVMLQGGDLSNLSEFPVLQMLYRQGMIIPGHPNNSGIKPLIMGDAKQVKAQMEYIYRGNYGLISEEEIIETGVSPERAKELMRLKLKFAFGQISDPKNLLDTHVISSKKEEIRNGVTVQRKGLNIYEFGYEGDTVQVDMNLEAAQSYESPYPLGYYQMKREYMSVLHSGEGDGWDINRPTMSSVLVFRGDIYLIDAGPNLSAILNSLGIGINEIKGIFHTHSHDDHFAGLTTLIRSDHKIKYFAAPMVRAAVTKKLSALLSIDEKDFSNYFEVHDLDIDEWNDMDGLEVKPIFSPHPVETTIFQFRCLGEEGYRTYAHYADMSSFEVLENMITDDDQAPGISQAMYDETKMNYLKAANLKKIDVGGGMIHGMAADFEDDKSNKIVLAHLARALSPAEKLIGSGSPFGTSDTLVPAHQKYSWRIAFKFLQDYFPDIPTHCLQPLLNNPVETFNPESILIKEGEFSQDTYIVVFGNVESVAPQTHITSVHSAGTLIGEMSALHGLPALETFRATSFVQALKISGLLFREFVKKNDLFGEISMLEENREFLQKTWLFGEAISYPIQNKLAKAMTTERFDASTDISDLSAKGLVMVCKGEVERSLDGSVLEIIESGNFFGEDELFFKNSQNFSIRTLSPVE